MSLAWESVFPGIMEMKQNGLPRQSADWLAMTEQEYFPIQKGNLP